jgi:phage tail sheath gpL-like
MTKIGEPNTTFNISGANTSVENAAQRILLVVQKLAAGTATVGTLIKSVQQSQMRGLFGTGSGAVDAILATRELNPVTPIDVIVVADGAGAAAAAGAILFAGAATEAGSYEVGVASKRTGVATIGVSVGDTDETVAAAVVAAFSTLTDCVAAVTIDGVEAAQVNITANDAQEEGNFIPIYIKGEVEGLTYTLTGMTGGVGVPTMTNVFVPIAGQRYEGIAHPGTFGTDELVTLLASRWNVNNAVLDGRGAVCLADTKANHVTALNLLNEKQLIYQCEGLETETDYDGPSIFETLFARSAQVLAVRALRLTDGENVSQFVNTAGGSDDGFGGPALASLPLMNTPMPWPVMEPGTGFGNTEVEEIKTAGGFVAGNNTAENGIVLGEVVTTYKTDAAGNPDKSFKYLNYVDTISAVRQYYFNNYKAVCSQTRLTDGDLVPNRNFQNKGSLTELAIQYYGDLSDPEYVLLVKSDPALAFFIENLKVTLDTLKGEVNIKMKAPIVTQLRTIIGDIQMAFNVKS